MKKALLLTLLFAMVVTLGFSQSDRFWSANTVSRSSITTDKAVARLSFPKEFKLFDLNIEPLRTELFSVVGTSPQRHSTVISLPNAAGELEQFEVYETSNFMPVLQARFPEIRAYTGKGITDKSAILKLSISPQGIQTMLFRVGRADEFIEAYSKDHATYAVFTSQREKGKLAWTCSTDDKQTFNGLKAELPTANATGSSAGELRTMRLAQSCNGEYSNYFGATSAAQVSLVLAAFNATLTRCNGVYEKDLALHLNLVPETVNVIYYDPATDPYTTLANWNTQLQIALNTTLTGTGTPIATNNAAYDIGHMFGASGGGGNAGCIGCVCVDGVASGNGATKGRGITSPADNIPMGDNFDIDYVVHEVGHQLGGNHTFSMSNEGTGVNKEVGSGITIMGYAGITSQDVAPHSIDIYHEATIAQIQANLATKTCPVTTNITANNATPVVAAVTSRIIPKQTPFALTGSATDANPGDVLTYCWEQNDDGTGQTGNNSVAYAAKPTGPNWLTFPATTSGTRLMPKLSTILAGLQITPVLPGGDAIANIEALSSVARTLNFRLTVRDNSAYVPVTAPGTGKVGQTAFTDMTVTVDAATGPFAVTAPNTAVTWAGGSAQTVTWSVNGTTGAPINCANVKISLSTDGGITFPTVLAASTANDGTESITVPIVTTTTARIKVEAVGNIFFDINDANFNITGGGAVNPTVTINQAATQLDPTSTSPINFTVVFSEPVTGFTAAGVTLAGTAGATTKVVTGGPTTFNVAVSGMTTSGTVIATVPANAATGTINVLPNVASTSTDNTVTYNVGVASCVTFTGSVSAADPSTSLRSFRDAIVKTCAAPGTCTAGLAGTFQYKILTWTNPIASPQCVTVTYANPTTNFSFVAAYNGAVTLTNLCTNWIADGGSSAPAGGAPIVWSFTAPASATISFLVTNITNGQTADYSIAVSAPVCAAAAAPTVTINQAATQGDPTSVSPINFTVVFSEPVTGFTAAGVTLAGTAGATTKVVTGGPTTYNVAVSGMTANGTVIATVPANAATGTVNPVGNTASTSTDNTVTFSLTCVPPTVNTPPNQVVCALANTAPVNFTGTPTAIFNWTNNNTAIGLAASGTGNIPSFVATNTTAAPIVGTITVTPSLPGGGPSGPISFTNPTLINIPQGQPATTSGPAGPYPSPITVSGLPTTGVSVQSITLTNIQHTWSGDIDVLLVSPTGQQFVPMSAVGSSAGFDNVATITIKDGSPLMPTTSVAIPSGTYGPTAGGTGTWPAPAPAGPYNYATPTGTSTFASSFNTTTNYNGIWSLYIVDHSGGDFGTIAGGWGITLVAPAVSTCFGTPVSFTITVNPNPALIIVADPGTTICEGDPTLLTVYNSAGFAPVALTQSTSTTITPGSVSCNAGGLHTDNSYWRAYNLAPLGLPSALTVNTCTFGVEQASGGAQPVTVRLYTQTTGTFPGGTRTLVGTQAATVPNQALSLFTVTFGTPVVVPNNAVLIVELFTPNGQATGRSFFIGSNAAAQTGPSYLSAADCGVATPTDVAAIGFPNMHIILNVAGTTGGVGSIATGTFLWSPAAGLSSTTSNPVAASPMNTTTYTVVRTGAGGCQSTASVTVTVNKRPVVTTQPISRTNCEGNTATFTVGATGTGLTYQWQVNTAGCTGGTWTNLANAAPYSGVNTATLSINPVAVTMSGYGYRCIVSGTCTPFTPPTNVSNCATLTVNANPVVAITPAGPVCGGVAGVFGTLLSTGSSAPPVPGTCTTASGAISVAVPDGSAAGIQSTLAVSCVPANATITGMRVNFNMPGHTYVGDMIFNLKAPNGTVLNLVKYMSGTATQAGTYPNSGFVNTTISSAGGPSLGTATTTPITGTWKADLLNGTIPFTIQDPAGFPSTATAWTQLYSVPNGTWTLAMADGGAGDVGTLTSWSIIFDYTTPGSGGGPVLSYVWSPLTGLYTNATATIPYTGTNLPSVYAAPTALTTYTVRATNVATGCFTDASVLVNYTPPAPTVTPSSVTMCLGDAAVRLVSSSSSKTTVTATSGTVNLPIDPLDVGDGTATVSTLNIAGVPAGSILSEVKVTMNINHTWVGDLDVNIKAPNNQILNLVGGLNGGTGSNGTANFTNTAFSSLGGATISGAAAPRTGTYAAEARAGYGANGYIQTVNTWAGLTPTPASANGAWTLAIGDFAAGDNGTLVSWSIAATYIVGVPTTAATWSPIAGLYNDAAASIAYTGDARDTVWTRPTPSGVYNFQATVQSLPAVLPTPVAFTNPAAITITNAGAGSTPYPSNLAVTGLLAGATVNSVSLNGLSHTWSDDIDVLLQSPTGVNVILMSDVGGSSAITNATYTFSDAGPAMGTGANPTGTYKPTNLVGTIGVEPDNWPAPGPGVVAQTAPALSMFTGNMNGTWKLFVVDDAAGDNGTLAGGYTIRFNVPIPPCTSPARTVVVTVNQPASITTQPVDVTICTDKVATFSVVAAGTTPLTYQWQVSTNGNNPPWTNVNNGGVYSGATTATLTITAPPVSMSGFFYRVVVNGAAPCGSVTSFGRKLTVNPLPTIVISASPTSLYPGLVANFTSTVTPSAAGPNGYVWLRDGAVLSGSSIGINSGIGTGSLAVNVDGLGVYQLRVTDVNGCTNVSNQITIKDSVTAKCFIYPNPTSGNFEVRYYSVAGNSNLPRYLTVYDAKGDRVYSKLYSIGRPYDRMPVDMRAYGKGLYWVEIGDANGNRLAMCRLVIQ